MGEFLGDRRRALEEEYFARQNRALLQRLQAAREDAERRVDPTDGPEPRQEEAACADDAATQRPHRSD